MFGQWVDLYTFFNMEFMRRFTSEIHFEEFNFFFAINISVIHMYTCPFALM